MTWSISASGPKPDVVRRVQSLTCPPEQYDASHFHAAKDHILEVLDKVSDAHLATVSASGHADDLVQYQSLSITSAPPEVDSTNE